MPRKITPEEPDTLDVGQEVVIAKKSHVIDRERAQEGLAPEERIPIEVEVTGRRGKVTAAPYESPVKNGEVCVPVELPSGAIVGVPASRLEPVRSGTRIGYSRRYSREHERIFGRKKKR